MFAGMMIFSGSGPRSIDERDVRRFFIGERIGRYREVTETGWL